MTVEPGSRLVVCGGGDACDVMRLLGELSSHAYSGIVIHCSDPDTVARLRAAAVAVTEVRTTTRIERGKVYVVPTDDRVEIRDRSFTFLPGVSPNNSLDLLMRSVADSYGPQSIGVILGGRGAHGQLGIKRIKEVGGITFALAGATGENAEMPRSAIATGVVDLVLGHTELALRLEAIAREQPSDDDRPQDGADTLREILSLVRIRTGHDFAAYKRATLFRRISRRMQVCQTATTSEYHRYLRDHPQELTALLRDFLIGVTNFFRDRDAFDVVARESIPKLFANKEPSEQIRVWVAGCATGEEVYSLAMLLAEHAAKLGRSQAIQVFATDIDEEALVEARAARYPESIALDVDQERLGRFFTPEGGFYRITKELREMVLFSPHNLLRDPPFSRLDLVTCRNLLIYLNREAQDRVLKLFHFALRPDGYLFLGSSESAENTSLFGVVDAKHRIYQRRAASAHSLDALVSTRWQAPSATTIPVLPAPVERTAAIGELHFRAVEQYAPPSILVNQELEVIHVSEHAGRFLTLGGGEPTKQLLRLALPELRLDLRTAIYAARQPGRGTESRVVRFEIDGKRRSIELRVIANRLEDLAPGTLLVMFDEQEPPGDLPLGEPNVVSMMEPVVREIEDELQRTRDQLRTTIEQYETSLEELKASNEELQAINEELRSATEELETSKEELQSVNEELTTLNQELKVKVDEVSHANSDLQNLMSSTDIGVLFLDRGLKIKRYTARAQDLFNVIPTDIGRPLSDLTHRLDTPDLAEQARSVLATLRTLEREVAGAQGRRYLMRLLPYRSLDDRIEGVVVTFVDVTDLRATEAALAVSEERLFQALRIAPLIMLSIAREDSVTWAFASGKQLSPAAAMALFSDAAALAESVRSVLDARVGQRVELDVTIEGMCHTYDFRLEPIARGVLAVGFDITPSKRAEASLREADRRKDEFLATLSHELRNPLTPLKVALDVAKLAKDDDKRTRSYAVMERQIAHLEALVDELLELSRITQGRIELRHDNIDIGACVEGAVEAARPIIERHRHQLAIAMPDGIVRVTGDLTRLTQVLTNLLINAAKYTPEGGKIALAVTPVPARQVVQMRVSDNGVGIPADMLGRIFDIFVQAHPTPGTQGGLGIGLSLVRKLVELHGGTVSASSHGENRGSELMVELPMRRSS